MKYACSKAVFCDTFCLKFGFINMSKELGHSAGGEPMHPHPTPCRVHRAGLVDPSGITAAGTSNAGGVDQQVGVEAVIKLAVVVVGPQWADEL